MTGGLDQVTPAPALRERHDAKLCAAFASFAGPSAFAGAILGATEGYRSSPTQGFARIARICELYEAAQADRTIVDGVARESVFAAGGVR